MYGYVYHSYSFSKLASLFELKFKFSRQFVGVHCAQLMILDLGFACEARGFLKKGTKDDAVGEFFVGIQEISWCTLNLTFDC